MLDAASEHQTANAAKPAVDRQFSIPILHIAQVRNLVIADAARHIPVKLFGVVTAMPGYRNSFFFEDSTAGISVDRTDQTEVHTGDRVEVTGTSGPGLFAPVVLASQVRVIGRAPPPFAPTMTLGDLFGGMQDSQWIELRGVVRSASRTLLFDRPIMLVALQLDGGSVNLQFQDFAGIDFTHLIDSVIRIRGVCASAGNDKRQFVGSTLLVPRAGDLAVEKPAPRYPFAGPSIAIGDVLKLGRWQHRVKVAGIVTYQVPGHAIYLQDGTDGIRVQTDSPGIARPGTRVDAVGFPAMDAYAPILEDGQFQIVGPGNPIAPTPIEAAAVIGYRDGANRAAYDQQLVEISGTVVEDYLQGDRHVWLIRQQEEQFEARLLVSATSAHLPPIPAGSLLRLTGICSIQVGSTLNPISFELRLRSPEDIVVLERGPWWTRDRSLSLLAILTGVTSLAFLWVAALRNRVERQTRAIRESEERFRYLSEHDGLTGLLNRSAILAALDSQLKRACRERQTLTLVLGDIDHFKDVNDRYGHLAGDAALLRFTAAVSESIRTYDSAGRYGGEEFLLVLPGIPDSDVENRIVALHGAMSNLAVRYQQTPFSITCSFGAVVVADCNADVNQGLLLAAADRALYQAKNAGRNRVVVQRHRIGALLPGAPRSAA